ncbi:HNH endonuclease [Paenibacillus elgii]|uniref:HNH endonuclease n=1 Tax=Paenibacillus elgii TaxID=189691 RepID=UPI00203B7D87|nr:HNH endonuclease [Paenibacillus elgii]MCM3273765.1 HNH endonuclease [Paenibacillus elgii]
MAKRKFNDYEIRGDTAVKFIKKRDGQILETLIDTEDLPRLIEYNRSWSSALNKRNKQGIFYYALLTTYPYPENKRKGKTLYLHTFIANAPEGYVVDHRNKDTLDNRKNNLRVTDQSVNMKNRSGINRNNRTGYRNVTLIDGKYIVQLQIEGKNTRLGTFDDADEAGEFAKKMRQKYYGECFIE